MSPNFSLPASGALILAAAAFGVHLGQSTIDQINPIHFQGPAVHPRDRGAVAYDMVEPQQPRFSQLYGWEEGGEARSLDCGGCDALDARDRHSDGELVYAVMETGWDDAPQQAAIHHPSLESAPMGEEEQAEQAVSPSNLELYSSFGIEAKDEPAEEPVEVAALQE
jgi:hypothetical protein